MPVSKKETKVEDVNGDLNHEVNEMTLDEMEDYLHLNESSGVKNNSSAADESDESANLDDDSVSSEEVIKLYEKIESLQYQNEINIQRLCTLELEDKKKQKELNDKEKMIKTHELENQELKKEMAAKKKFLFRM